jgi:hypothetical protein
VKEKKKRKKESRRSERIAPVTRELKGQKDCREVKIYSS